VLGLGYQLLFEKGACGPPSRVAVLSVVNYIGFGSARMCCHVGVLSRNTFDRDKRSRHLLVCMESAGSQGGAGKERNKGVGQE